MVAGRDVPVRGNTRIAPLTCSFLLRSHALVQVLASPVGATAIDGGPSRSPRTSHRAPEASGVDDSAEHERSMPRRRLPDVEEKPLRDRFVEEVPPRAPDYGRKAAESAPVVQARNGFEPVSPSSSTLV